MIFLTLSHVTSIVADRNSPLGHLSPYAYLRDTPLLGSLSSSKLKCVSSLLASYLPIR